MAVFRELRRQGRPIIVFVAGVMLIGYFAYHAVEGERGLRSYFALQHRTETAQSALDALRGEREILERRVRLLRPDSLDLDMLEERARRILGFVREDERVILPNDRSEQR